WAELQKFCPRVSRVGRKLLCIPATSAPSERPSSGAGPLLTQRRTDLKPDKISTVSFLR
ncbi:unnamed protein product, partial [Discosporangium mesarthrocarpum]